VRSVATGRRGFPIATLMGVLAAVMVSGACGSSEDPAKLAEQAQQVCRQAVADEMRDPESVRFRGIGVEFMGEATPSDLTYIDGYGADRRTTEMKDVPGRYWKVHGEVNAKNGFGAYNGFKSFKCEAKLYENGRPMRATYVNVGR